MDPVSKVQSEEENIVAAKTFAKVFLGHGYNQLADKKKNKLLEQTLEQVALNKIDIREAKSESIAFCAANCEEASNEFQRKMKFKLGLKIPEILLSSNYQNQGSSHNISKTIVYAATHIDYMKCCFNEIPARKNIPLSDQRLGDGFVSSGWVYTGFRIYFEITFKERGTGSNSNFGVEANAGYGPATIGFSFDTINSELKNKKITCISMRAKGFGSYSIPFVKLKNKVGSIEKAVKEIKADYDSRMHTIRIRKFSINEDCLREYRYAPEARLVPTSLAIPMLRHTTTTPIGINIQPVNFYELAKTITGEFSNENSVMVTLKNLSIGKMFSLIDTIFSNLITPRDRINAEVVGYTLVAGCSGKGKSILIGYQLGAEYEKRYHQAKHEWVLDYPAIGAFGNYPSIGHTVSETKGFAVYQQYVDTAGLFDTGGREKDICNSMAITSCIQNNPPKRLIFVLSPADFRDNRSRGLFEIIDRLKHILIDPTKPKIFSSILFIVNNKFNPTGDYLDVEKILGWIQGSIQILAEERDKDLLTHEGYFRGTVRRAKSWALGDEDIREKINRLAEKDPRLANRVLELQNSIEILEKFSKENIMLANFDDDRTRQMILAWEKQNAGLSPDCFRMENLMDGYTEFTTLLHATASYFNQLFAKKLSHISSIDNLKEEIQQKRSHLQSLENANQLQDNLSRKDQCRNQIDLYRTRLNPYLEVKHLCSNKKE